MADPQGPDFFERDDTQWHRLRELFDHVLSSDDPASVIASIENPDLRESVLELWQHHTAASRENFLEETIDFQLLPVFESGQVLANRFKVQRALGAGGMGEVYLAFDEKLGEPVAIKTIARLLVHSDSIRTRFLKEVRNARRVTHPGVCRIYDLFEEGPIAFFAMEYLEGCTLDRVLDAGPAAEKKARELVLQLAEGLSAAHSSGVVHGDFKPSNIMVVEGRPPRAVIMDFGLALAFGQSTSAIVRERSIAAGTLDYMAPELSTGQMPSALTDIFAFGKVAALLLPGKKIWSQCTEPRPERRLQSLEGVLRYMRQQRTRRYWIGGAAAAAVAGVVYRASDPLGSGPRIESSARLLINGFRTKGADQSIANAARGLLVSGLQQSPRIRVVSDRDLLIALQGLQPKGKLPVSGELLRHLVSLQRATYWIEAQLTRLSGRYSLSLNLLRVSDERPVDDVEFKDTPDVGPLAASSAVWIRRLAGESAQSLVVNPADATAFTSKVPEAQGAYYSAMDHYILGEMADAIPLLEEAVRLDPGFAQAHNILGMCFNSTSRYVEAFAHLDRARGLAARLPSRERAWIDSNYFALVENPDEMVRAARSNKDLHPDEPRFYRILARDLCWTGHPEESIVYSRKAAELSPTNDLNQSELIFNLCEAGEFTKGLEEYQRLKAAGSENPYLDYSGGFALMGLERYEEASRLLGEVADDPDLYVQSAKILRGDIESSAADLQQEFFRAGEQGNVARQHKVQEFLCGIYYLTDQTAKAASQLSEMAALPEVPPFARPLQCTAFWAARLEQDSVLEQVRASLETIAGQWPNGLTRAAAKHSEALVSWRRGDLDRALTSFTESLGTAFTIWTLFDLADYYTATKRFDLAEEYWRKVEARRGTILKLWFPGVMLYGWLNRATVALERGDSALARSSAKRVTDQWRRKNAHTGVVRKAETVLKN